MAGLPPVPKGGTVPKGTSGSYGSFRAAIPNANTVGIGGNHLQPGAYENAVKTVFGQQSAAQKMAILKGALANPNLPSSKVVLSLVPKSAKQAGVLDVVKPSPVDKAISSVTAPVAKTVGHAIGTALHDVKSSQQYANSATEGSGSKSPFLFPVHAGAAAPGAVVTSQIGKNLFKDAIDLPAQVETSLAVPGVDIAKGVGAAATGHFGKAFGDWADAGKTFVSPYIAFAKDPGGMLTNHPLDAYLMAMGALHPALRAAEYVGRKATGAGPVDLARPAAHITANMNVERPDYATNPLYRSFQKGTDSAKFNKNPDGTVSAKNPRAESSLIRLRVARLANQGELPRRFNRDTQVHEHLSSVLKGRTARGLHAVKTALSYDPKAPTIPGASVLRLIAEGVVRRPDTIAEDLQKHIAEVSARRPDLLDRADGNKQKIKADLATHDKFIKTLQDASHNEAFLKNPGPAFRAAGLYAKVMKGLTQGAYQYGHYRDMSPEALQRRVLMPVVRSHWPGARLDEKLGMVEDTPTGPRPLSTAEMQQFARKETGGRDLAYVPHGADPGNRAFYVHQGRRPSAIPAEHTTLWNFTHGLADPGHEPMLKTRVLLRGVIDAHEHKNQVDHETLVLGKDGKGWNSRKAALAAAPDGYVPILRASYGYPTESLGKAMNGVDLTTVDQEAERRGLDYHSRLADNGAKGPGAWGLIDKRVADQLQAHEKNVSPDYLSRSFRSANQMFRTAALGTSFRHLPGVAAENIVRSAAAAVGPVSWVVGHMTANQAERLDPELGAKRRVQLTGGQKSGQVLRAERHSVASNYEGTPLHGVVSGWEKAMKAPGPRQARTLWRTWTHFTLGTTKKMLEEQAQYAAIGKHTINDFGGRHGLLALAMGQWGHMIDQASKGILDERGLQRFQNTSERIYGRWGELTPVEQKVLMFSPFGTWWLNSVKFLARMPVDHPMLTGALAAANVGTQGKRFAQGMDLFAPNAVPPYLQGGVPLGGGKILESNYYSPFGVANDPLGTASSLMLPWEEPLFYAAQGDNWHGGTAKTPTGSHTNTEQRIIMILNSLAASFIPVYQKAQEIAQGGASSYDTSTLFHPETKGPNPGPLAGLKAAVNPAKIGKVPGYVPSGKGGGGSSISLPSVNIPSVNLPSVNLPG